MKILNKTIIIILLITVLDSCTKKDDNNISIQLNTVLGTPAEAFSVQQIKMFAASNVLIFDLLHSNCTDSLQNNFIVAPFYMINNIMSDSLCSEWNEAFRLQHNLADLSYKQQMVSFNNFLSTVKDIDSSLLIGSDMINGNMDTLFISQNINIPIICAENNMTSSDNIFTTIDNRKPKTEFILSATETNLFISEEEKICEILVGNGNYSLVMILPVNTNIFEYIKDFTIKKYSHLLNKLEMRKISVLFPKMDITYSDLNILIPEIHRGDSVKNFPKRIVLNSHFSFYDNSEGEISYQNRPLDDVNIFAKKNSNIITYDTPFLFIIRDRNSDLIMSLGVFLCP